MPAMELSPAPAGLFFARPHQIPAQLLPNLVLVSAKEAGGLRHRPAAGELVRQVTDIFRTRAPELRPSP